MTAPRTAHRHLQRHRRRRVSRSEPRRQLHQRARRHGELDVHRGTGNYNNASGTAAIVITKANATINVNGYTGVYDGAAHGATGTATGVGGGDSAGLNLGASFTNVPGGTANWTFTGDGNYNDASGTAAIVITKADATVTVNGYTGVYDGAAHGATGTATGVGGVT